MSSAETGTARGGRARRGQPNRGRPRRADPARRAAFDVLSAVAERDAYANLLLPALLTERGLTGRDAALATELAYGVLRAQGGYDAIIAICSDRDLDRVDQPLRLVLRLGAHQLLATRIGAHAAVATSVDLARDVAGQRPAGFVNAVLRRVATRGLESWLEIAAPARDRDLVGHLSVRYSHPRWIVTALSEALGDDPAGGLAETEAVLAADGERPQVNLCAVPGRAGQQELVASGATAARWSPFGAYLAEGDPGRIAAVAEGRAAVQDEASQLAALALARAGAGGAGTGGLDASEAGRDRASRDEAGAVWLDTCAGPGGKARLLAGLAQNRGPGCSPPTFACTAPGCPGARSAAPWAPASWWRTGPRRPGGPVPSPGSWPTSRARVWARCAAGPRCAGAAHPRTWPGWARYSAPCWPRRWTRPHPAESSPTSPAPRTWPKPATS